MDGMELIAFQIISNVGMAKSLAIEALRAVREGNNEEADKKLKEAREFQIVGHHAHADLIQKEAAGEKLDFSLILMHAEDQLISTETIIDLAVEMIAMYRDLKNNTKQGGDKIWKKYY